MINNLFDVWKESRCTSMATEWPVLSVVSVLAINVTGIVGNVLLIIAHVKDPLKHFKFPSSLFIFIIAILDLLISCTSSFFYISYNFFTVHQIPNVLIMMFHSVSFVMYLSLAIERFFSVAFPFWHRVHVTTAKCRNWVVGVWLVCAIVGVVQYVIRTRLTEYKNQLELAQVVFMWVMFLATQCVYIACYISIKKQNTIVQRKDDMNEATARTIKLRLKNENNFLLTIAIVCFILALTILPFTTMAFIFILNAAVEKAYKQAPSYYIWGMLGIGVNSAVNIFIYLWRLPKYRDTFKKLYCDCYKG